MNTKKKNDYRKKEHVHNTWSEETEAELANLDGPNETHAMENNGTTKVGPMKSSTASIQTPGILLSDD